MRLGVHYDNVKERIGGLLNLVPEPVGYSMFGMPVARAMQVAQRVGAFRELAAGPATASDLAQRLGLREEGTRLLLDSLCAARQLRRRSGRYEMPSRVAKWLDPSSETYLGDFVGDNYHYWAWWAGLEDLVRDGHAVSMHDRPADDPYWRSYITGQYQLARLSSDAVAKAVDLPAGATSLLDVAGAHGEFAMALCRRHDGLMATVVDLPGSARVGREIVGEAGMAERVAYVEGDMFEADYGGPHDGALTFNIVHHLSPERATALFERIAAALRPGAPLCVLDLYVPPEGKRPDSGSFLGLFFHLTSGADLYRVDQVAGWLRAAGFGETKVKRLDQLPGLALLRAEKI
jgi:hypothetical protein